MRPTKFRTIGVITGAHGLDGSLTLKPSDPDMPWLETLEVVYLVTPKGIVEKPIDGAESYGQGLKLQLEGITDRTEAEKLRGLTVQLPESMLPELEEDEFYTDELAGMAVYSEATQKPLGVVSDVVSSSAGDYLEVKAPGLSEPVLVPFLSVFVTTVDKAQKRIGLQGLDSLFEEPSEA